MIVLVLLLAGYAFGGAHATWDCAPGARAVLYDCDRASGFVPGQDVTRGAGLLGPSLRFDPDPLRRQRLADQQRMDAMLRGD